MTDELIGIMEKGIESLMTGKFTLLVNGVG
jgi:hypothetical protein